MSYCHNDTPKTTVPTLLCDEPNHDAVHERVRLVRHSKVGLDLDCHLQNGTTSFVCCKRTHFIRVHVLPHTLDNPTGHGVETSWLCNLASLALIRLIRFRDKYRLELSLFSLPSSALLGTQNRVFRREKRGAKGHEKCTQNMRAKGIENKSVDGRQELFGYVQYKLRGRAKFALIILIFDFGEYVATLRIRQYQNGAL